MASAAWRVDLVWGVACTVLVACGPGLLSRPEGGALAAPEDLASSANAGAGDPSWVDTGWAQDGMARRNLGGHEDIRDVVLDAQGRVILAGSATSLSGTEPERVVVARMLPDGEMDPSFGTAGGVHLDRAVSGPESIVGVAVQADARPLVLIWYQRGPDDSTGASEVGRLCEDGTPDPEFGAAGFVTLPAEFVAWDVKVSAGGGVLVSGTRGGECMVMRLTAQGAPDTTFGDQGVVSLGFVNAEHSTSACGDMAPLQDDALLVVATDAAVSNGYRETGALLKLRADGKMDTSFASGGVLPLPRFPNSTWLRGLAVQSDGAIAMAGRTDDEGSRHELAVQRYLPDGTLDRAFGEAGTTVVDVSEESWDRVEGLVPRPGGGLEMALTAFLPPGGAVLNRMASARLDAQGRLVASFGRGGVATLQPDRSSGSAGVLPLVDGSSLLCGSVSSLDRGTLDLVAVRLRP